ncbi:nucleotide-binding universal stress UspA family protein [Prosthecobacter fusiformis]|uniref:Nucleotide-binding universal stress UspA family protein n=1 Tax=Prosthecobacter fusiformis TaxID=48464 RepID=A0A4R7RZZ3_9BACT|nr:universal stress protein [Prosthecobacter fusiformis]TDU71461.1 nucleotide-binding universal stress UspA family protein [Prosthecobacter fusiformis]
MKAYSNIIAAIDFTPSCRNALREAVRIAAANEATMTAVHVMDEFLAHELKRALSTDLATVRADFQKRLKTFVEESDLGTAHVEIEVRIGHPFLELSEACRVHAADLLIMGAKGSRNDPGRVGVIAAKCVRKAPVDVMLVREDAVGPFKHLVTCVDFSENSIKAVQCALKLAQQDGASLDCLHVYQSALAMSLDYGGLVAPMPLGTDAQAMGIWQEDLVNFMEPLKKEFPGVTVNSLVLERVNIREAILDHVKETHADMVVLGTRGKTGLRELLIGTTAEKIVANAPCSILAVKPEGFGKDAA